MTTNGTQQTESKGAYRDKPKPCRACEERESAAKAMHPFAMPDDRRCPECKSHSLWIWCICRGGPREFRVKKGWWFTKWGEVTFTCGLKRNAVPRHFHLQCKFCEHRWTMLTATESKAE